MKKYKFLISQNFKTSKLILCSSNYLIYVHSISVTPFLVAILKQKAIKLSILGAMSLIAPRERISSRSDVKELGRLHSIMLSNKSGNLLFNVYFVTCISENYSGLVIST